MTYHCLAGPYFLSAPERDFAIYGYGWWFPTNIATQMLIAAKLAAPNETEASYWRDMAAMHLHYVLGINPQGFSLITGVGARRFTNPVDQESLYDDLVGALVHICSSACLLAVQHKLAIALTLKQMANVCPCMPLQTANGKRLPLPLGKRLPLHATDTMCEQYYFALQHKRNTSSRENPYYPNEIRCFLLVVLCFCCPFKPCRTPLGLASWWAWQVASVGSTSMVQQWEKSRSHWATVTTQSSIASVMAGM
jgi:hypothetical protein